MLSMIQINNFMSKIKVSTKLNFLRQRGQRIRSPGNLYRARFLKHFRQNVCKQGKALGSLQSSKQMLHPVKAFNSAVTPPFCDAIA